MHHKPNSGLPNTLFLFKGAKTHSTCQFLVHSSRMFKTTRADLCHWARVEITEKEDSRVSCEAQVCCEVSYVDGKTLELALTTQ